MSIKTEKQLARKTYFENEWFKMSVDTVSIDGISNATRIVINHICASCVLAITDSEQVVLVRQYRYATNEELLEIPAGKLDMWGGDFFETASRELAEETPYTATHLQLLSAFYTVPGFCDEFIHLYKATGLKANSTLKPDEDEFVEIELYTKMEVKELLKTGAIRDAKTIIALQFWLLEDDTL